MQRARERAPGGTWERLPEPLSQRESRFFVGAIELHSRIKGRPRPEPFSQREYNSCVHSHQNGKLHYEEPERRGRWLRAVSRWPFVSLRGHYRWPWQSSGLWSSVPVYCILCSVSCLVSLGGRQFAVSGGRKWVLCPLVFQRSGQRARHRPDERPWERAWESPQGSPWERPRQSPRHSPSQRPKQRLRQSPKQSPGQSSKQSSGDRPKLSPR